MDTVLQGLELSSLSEAKTRAAPKISLRMTNSRRNSGHCALRGMTAGVVVGETVVILITDVNGNTLNVATKVAGDGFYGVRADLSSLANGELKVIVISTALDGTAVKVEESAQKDLCLINEGEKEKHFIEPGTAAFSVTSWGECE
jgi:gas vesicle protein